MRIAHFEVQGEIARGGMGVVYRAWDARLGREVALKRLLSFGPVKERRFFREAQAAAALDHPNIVRIHEVGRDSDGIPYIAMALIPGRPLDEALPAGSAAPSTVLSVCRDVARGLGAAHDVGIVHRDLKPQNILVVAEAGGRYRPVITDFGLAKMDHADPLTREAAFIGTAHYASPEQAMGERDRVGPPSDVWSLGVVLYEQVTGIRPFYADSLVNLLRQITQSSPRPPSAVRPGLPPAVDEICRVALEHDPADRYPDGRAMAQAIEAAVGEGTSTKLSTHRRRRRLFPVPSVRARWLVALSGAAALLGFTFLWTPGPGTAPGGGGAASPEGGAAALVLAAARERAGADPFTALLLARAAEGAAPAGPARQAAAELAASAALGAGDAALAAALLAEADRPRLADPTLPERIALALVAEGWPGPALDALGAAGGTAPVAAEALLALGRDAEARAIIDALPPGDLGFSLLARSLAVLDPEGAADAARAVRDPRDRALTTARVSLRRGDDPAARSALLSAWPAETAGEAPSREDGARFLLLAEIEGRTGRFARAAEAYGRAAAAPGEAVRRARALAGRAIALLFAGSPPRAPAIQEAIGGGRAVAPLSPAVAAAEALLLRTLAAEEEPASIPEPGPGRAGSLLRAARVEAALWWAAGTRPEGRDAVLRAFRRARAFARDPGAIDGEAEAALAPGPHGPSPDASQRALDLYQRAHEGRYYQEDPEGALRLLDEAIALDPGCIHAQNLRVAILGRLLRTSDAIVQHYRWAAAAPVEIPDLEMNIDELTRPFDPSAAVTALTSAAGGADATDDPVVLAARAGILFTCLVRDRDRPADIVEDARALIDRAVEAAPGCPLYHALAAGLDVLAGYPQAGTAGFATARRLAGASAGGVAYIEAEALAATGNVPAARDRLEEALLISPGIRQESLHRPLFRDLGR